MSGCTTLYSEPYTAVCDPCAVFPQVDISIVNRWNIAIGLPDEAAYMMGNAIVMQVPCPPIAAARRVASP